MKSAKAPCRSAVRSASAVLEEVPQARQTSIALMAAVGEHNSERGVHRLAKKCKLTLPIPLKEIPLGKTKMRVSVILLSSWVQFIMQYNLWHTLSGLHEPNAARCAAQWTAFWAAYRCIYPTHPIFSRADRGEVNLATCAALLLHGDEGRTLKKAALLVLSAHSVLGFGSNANPNGPEEYAKMKVNSTMPTWSTRWLLGVLPKTFYECSGGNIVLQDYLNVFAQDMLGLYETGVQSLTGEKHHVVVLHCMGDWPYFAKCFRLTRSFANCEKRESSRAAPKGICHVCLAGREFVWEDFERAEPGWRRSVNQESAFEGSPSLLQLPHVAEDPSSFLGQDLFHAWHIGAAKQFLGSCLVLASETFPGSSVPTRFENMSTHFFRWCKLKQLQPYIRKLTRDTAGWPTTADFPSGTWVKGSTSTVILRWFVHVCADRSHLIEVGSLLFQAAEAAKEIYWFFSKIYKEDVFIEGSKAFEIGTHGLRFLKLHARCAKMAHACHRPMFVYMPNLHRLHHLFFWLVDGSKKGLTLSPQIWNCQTDEDYVGRPSRVSRRVSPMTVIERTLLRGLEAAHAKFKKVGFLQ